MTLDTTERMMDASTKKGRSNMRNIFKRKDKGFNVKPTVHIAYLHIINNHLEVDEKIDLSRFTMDELQEIIDFIEFKGQLQVIDSPDEFSAVVDAYKDDEYE